MLLERDRKLFHLFAVISIALSLIVCIPFSLEKITLFEIIVKYMVIPVAIAIFTFSGWSGKYRSYRPAVKFTTIITYTPILSYAAAVLFNTVLILVRNSAVYEQLQYNLLIMGLSAFLVLFIAIAHVYSKFVIKLSKNEALLADGILAALVLAYTIGGSNIAFDYRAIGGLESKSALFIVVPLILGIAAAYLHVLVLKNASEQKQEYVIKEQSELLGTWEENCATAQKIYNIAKANIIENLNLASSNQPQEEVEEVEEQPQEVVEETVEELPQEVVEETVEEQPQEEVEKDEELINSLQQSLDEIKSEREAVAEDRKKIEDEIDAQKAEIQAKLDAHAEEVALEEKQKAEALEKARIEAERKAKEAELRAQENTVAFNKACEVADKVAKGYEDVKITVNEKQTLYKYIHKGVPFIILQKATNDYRVSFLAKTEEMRELLYQYNGVVNFDKVIEFAKIKNNLLLLKAVHKAEGAITLEFVEEVLVKSLNNLKEAEELTEQAIIKEKEAKERAKQAEKALKQAEKAKAKEEAKNKQEAA